MALWILLLALLYAVLWLQGGPRDLNWARERILAALNPAGAPYQISIDRVSMHWENINDVGHLRVTQMQVAQKNGGVFATLPQVEITLDPFGFLPGRRLLQGIAVDNADLSLTRDAQGVVRVGAEGVHQPMAVKDLTAFFSDGTERNAGRQASLPFRALTLNNASLVFTDAASQAVLTSRSFSFFIRRAGQQMTGRLAMPFDYNGTEGNLDATLRPENIGTSRVLQVRAKNLPGDLACVWYRCPEGMDFRGNVSANATLHQSREGEIKGAFSVATSQAKLTAPTLFPEPLTIKRAQIDGRAARSFATIRLDEVEIALADTTLKASGNATKAPEGWNVAGEGSASALSMKKLYRYWPLVVAKDTRDWVSEHITDGIAQSATLKMDFRPEDFNSDVMRDEALASHVEAKGLTIHYIPGFPQLNAVDGTVDFTGKTMHVKAVSGTLLKGTVLQSAVLDCKNLDDPKAPMTTTLTLRAPAGDVATMLKLPPFTFDDAVDLNPATITGTVESTLKLGFDGFSGAAPQNASDVDFSNVSYDVNAKLTNIGQPKLLDGRDISGLSGQLRASDAGVNFDGQVKVEGGTNVALTMKDIAGTTTVTAKGTLAKSQFATFGVPPISQLGEGSVGVDAQIALARKGTRLNRATLDLTRLALDVPEISWAKKAGEAASVSLTPGSTARSYTITAKAPDLTIGKSTLQFTEAMDDVAQLRVGSLKTSRNDFALDYAKTTNGYRVNLTGARLDNSVAFAQPGDGEGILADFPPLDLTVDLGALILSEKYPLRQLKGTLRCAPDRCQSADLRAQTGEGALSLRISPENGQRRLVLQSTNAGDTLRALDVSDRMFGGRMEVKGTYDDAKNPAPFTGRLLIERFKLKNSEILARIVSIGSLSGLVNVLTGEGIDFKKAAADLSATAGVIKVKKGQLDSNALGLTANGTVDTAKSTLNLKGVVVPANSLNSLFGKIPLIGKLAGGEGEGLIAFNYSVKGAMADPEVFVNPLSGLTPGFLRGIFTLGDKDPTAEPAPEPGEAPKAEDGETKTPDITLPEPTKPATKP